MASARRSAASNNKKGTTHGRHRHPVTEDELHLHVDGELPAGRREAVEAWLANHPEDAARVAAWRAQAEAIRARYGARRRRAGSGPAEASDASCARRRSWGAIAAAAAVAAFVVGGVAGWMARGASAAAPSQVAGVHQPTRSARTGSTSARCGIRSRSRRRRPICCRGCRGALGTTLRAPDLGAFGLKLLGGRLLPGVERPGGAVHVRGRERRALHDLLLASSTRRARRSATTTTNNFGSVHWIEGNYGWALSGPKDRDAAEGDRRRGLRAARKPRRAAAQLGHSALVAPRIVGLAVAPLLHERLELGIGLVGQHDAHRRVEIAGAVL